MRYKNNIKLSIVTVINKLDLSNDESKRLAGSKKVRI